jgi:ribosomal protein S27E
MATKSGDVERRIARVECSNCGRMVNAYRTKGGRVLCATGGAVIAGGIGAAVGTGIGIATGGWGAPATYYLGTLCAGLGGGGGYILGDSVDTPRCPKCEEQIDLGI